MQHALSSSLTKDRTQVPCIGNMESAIGPPGKSPAFSLKLGLLMCWVHTGQFIGQETASELWRVSFHSAGLASLLLSFLKNVHYSFFFFSPQVDLFIYFGCAGSWLLHSGFSLVSARGGFSVWWLLLWSTGSAARAHQELWHRGLVAPRQVGSFWTRCQTHVPSIGRWIFNHWTTREVLSFSLFPRFFHLVQAMS